MMDHQKVRIGQLWKRKNGVVYRTAACRGIDTFDFLLVPVYVPDGIKARKSWKWDQGIRFEMECVGNADEDTR